MAQSCRSGRHAAPGRAAGDEPPPYFGRAAGDEPPPYFGAFVGRGLVPRRPCAKAQPLIASVDLAGVAYAVTHSRRTASICSSERLPLVGHLLDALGDGLQLGLAEGDPDLARPVADGVLAGEAAPHDEPAREAERLGRDDLVRAGVHRHRLEVHARLVRVGGLAGQVVVERDLDRRRCAPPAAPARAAARAGTAAPRPAGRSSTCAR